MADLNRTCESCGAGFWQGRGRPARRCPKCRAGDRYGPGHRALRAETVDQAIGKPCARCQRVIQPGELVQLDHADHGGGYLGYSHQACNARAGAVAGNRARAAAYRAAKGLPAPAGPVVAGNGAALGHQCEPSGCHPVPGGPCACGRHSRAW